MKRELKGLVRLEGEAVEDQVTEIFPMKRELKVRHLGHGIATSPVTEIFPMKRELKVIV